MTFKNHLWLLLSYLAQVLTGGLLAVLPEDQALCREGITGTFAGCLSLPSFTRACNSHAVNSPWASVLILSRKVKR